MKLKNIMSTQLITLDLDSNLDQAKILFDKHKIHHLPVIGEDGELLGLITDRDLYKHLSPTAGTVKQTTHDFTLLKKKVNLIMSRDIISASKNLPVKEALVMLDEYHVSCLPVIDDELRLIGMVSWRDIIKVFAQLQRASKAG